jgi:cytochrome P450 family 2 subfamily U polypeptide 1
MTVDILTVVYTFFVIVISILWYNRKKYWTLRHIPGPCGLPIIGNMTQLSDREPIHETMRRWANIYGDIYKFTLMRDNIVMVNSEKGIREMLITKSEDFAGRPSSFRINYMLDDIDILFGPFGDRFSHLKRLTSTGLKLVGEGVERLEEIAIDIIDEALKDMEEKKGEAFDPRELIHHSVADITSSLVGIDIF